MTPARFSQIGELLYGPSWRAALAAALNVGERTVRRWAAGDHRIPDGIAGDLAGLCRERSARLMKAAEELDHQTNGENR